MYGVIGTDLTVDISSSIQKHLDHGLVSTDTRVHQRGHPLENTPTQDGDRIQTVRILLGLSPPPPAHDSMKPLHSIQGCKMLNENIKVMNAMKKILIIKII
jgi:hypothetical protein